MRVFLFRDEKGRKRYRTEVVHGKRREAEARLLELLQVKSTGSLTPRSRLTVRDLAREWSEHKVRDVAPRTLEQYKDALERYVLPVLGHRKLGDLTLREVDQLYGLMLAGELPAPDKEGAKKPRKLSARTVRLTHAALSQALSQAVRWCIIQHNPAPEATIPAHRPKEKQVLTGEERARFLEAASDSFYRLLVDTGLRPGEASALRWPDVDLERGAISVHRTVTSGKDGEEVLAERAHAQAGEDREADHAVLAEAHRRYTSCSGQHTTQGGVGRARSRDNPADSEHLHARRSGGYSGLDGTV